MSKTNPEQPYTWATDDTFSSGDASGRDTKTDPAGWPDVAQGFVPGTAGASPYLNKAKNVDGKWLNFLRDVHLANWDMVDISGLSPADLKMGCWLSSLGLAGFAYFVGNDTIVRTDDFFTYEDISASAVVYVACFATETTSGSVIGLTGGDTLYDIVGATNNTETASDELWVGIYDPDSGNDIVAGFLAGADLGFLYGTTTGTSDLSVSGDTFSVPDLGGGGSTERGNVDQNNIHLAQDGAGRILCLVSYHSGSAGRVDQLISTDGGVNWAETQNVAAGVSASVATGCHGLAWDASRSLWIAAVGQKLYSAAAAGSSSWTEVADSSDIWGSVGQTLGRVIADGTLWIVQNTSNAGFIAWSRDGGTTWNRHRAPAGGAIFVHCPDRGTIVIGDKSKAGSDNYLAASLCVGP